MEQMEQATESSGAGRMRVETLVESMSQGVERGETVADLAHDARNMVTALALYCDLLEEPGVLTDSHLHYGPELRIVTAASRRLVEKLEALEGPPAPTPGHSQGAERSPEKQPSETARGIRLGGPQDWGHLAPVSIENLAEELRANRNLLAALAGASVAVSVNITGGAMPVRLTGEDLTRVLVNLVKNSAEAMPAGGRVALGLHEFHAGGERPPWLLLAVEDSGQGIPREELETIFEAGYTTRANGSPPSANGTPSGGGWMAAHRGLGLSITRSIVEAAGGRIHAQNNSAAGARFEIELPVRIR
jgi:signal transduction histidine kinase